jgi:hypothetical protein
VSYKPGTVKVCLFSVDEMICVLKFCIPYFDKKCENPETKVMAS